MSTRHVMQAAGGVDDHNTPSLLIEAGRIPMVFWTQHNADNLIRYKRGTTALDLTTLGDTQTIDIGGPASYSQCYRNPSTMDLFLLARNGNQTWVMVESANDGVTWGTPFTLMDYGTDEQCYIGSVQVGSTIRCIAYGHPTNSTLPEVRYFQIDMSDGSIDLINGTNVANLDGTNLPLTPADLGIVFDPAGSNVTRTLDVSAATNPEVVFVDYNTSDPTAGLYKVATWNGSSWDVTSIVATGARFGDSVARHYIGGASFPNPTAGGSVYLSRESSGTWTLERWTRSGSTWTLAETVTSSTTRKTVRPSCPVGRSTGPAVIWSDVGSYTSYLDYVANIGQP